ncbi:helix-turn-helix transcriptional regulator [Serratia fonticola]|nr:helix-turn-helix transcriptional regulator [Serratia fonticola]
MSGESAQEIGRRLSISVKTVYAHRYNAFLKLGVRGFFELVNINSLPKVLNSFSR